MLRPLVALTLAVLALATPVQAADLSRVPDVALPVESPVPLPETPDQPPDVCFEHNDRALTNACFTYDPRTVAATGVSRTPGQGLCAIGNECFSTHPETHQVPGYAFYVEVTLLCNAGREPCRVEN